MSRLISTFYKVRHPELLPAHEAEYRHLRPRSTPDETGANKPALVINHGWYDDAAENKKAVDPRTQLLMHFESVQELNNTYNEYVRSWVHEGFIHCYSKDVFDGEVYTYYGDHKII